MKKTIYTKLTASHLPTPRNKKFRIAKKNENFATTGVSIKEAFEKFICDRIDRNNRDATIRSYKDGIRNFFKFTDGNKYITVREIDSELVGEYSQYLIGKGIKPASRKSYFSTLKAFVNFCREKKFITRAVDFPNITLDDPGYKSFTDKEVQKLLKEPTSVEIKQNGFVWHRSFVFMYYLLSTGNRLNTAIHVRVQDIDFTRNEIILKVNKDRKTHKSPLDKNLKKILKDFISMYSLTEDSYVFCSIFGNKISSSQIQKMVKVFCNGRGVERSNVHSARHYFCRKSIENGIREFDLMELMHHKTLEQTLEYVQVYSSKALSKAREIDVYGNKYSEKRNVLFPRSMRKVS